MVVMSQSRLIEWSHENENGEILSHFIEVDESQICNRKYYRDRFYRTETDKL